MVVVFYICLFVFIYASGLIYTTVDYEFWARLIVGKTYFQTGEVLKNDFLSYTQHTHGMTMNGEAACFFISCRITLAMLGYFF
jgi:hypothetical protein